MHSESLFTIKAVHSQRCRGGHWLGSQPLSERRVGETATGSALRHILSAKSGKHNHWLQGASGPRAGARLGSQRRSCVAPCPLGNTRRVIDSLGSVSPTGNGRGWMSCSGRPLSFLPPHRPLFQESYTELVRPVVCRVLEELPCIHENMLHKAY